MTAPPWWRASTAHFHTWHDTHNIMHNNISSFTNYWSPFHSKTDLCEYAREIYILLRKITGSRMPFYFNIESHKGILTIAYYMRYFNDQMTHSNADTTRHQLQITLKAPTPLNNIIALMSQSKQSLNHLNTYIYKKEKLHSEIHKNSQSRH